MAEFDASAVASGASGKQKEKGQAREISTVDGSSQTLQQIAASDKDDQFKYQYAVDLAKQDLNGDTSDTDEFRNLVDDYYKQMDPGTPPEKMRGETGVTQAIRFVGEGVDNVNDLLGDGIDWLWDNTIGNIAGGIGGLVGAFANDSDLGEEWKQAASDVVSEDTADAIANMGTGMLISAIPGIGVPLSIGLTAAQNADDIYEALVGRDAVTRERLSEAERIGRAGSAILDTALAAAPAVGKASRYIRGGNAIDDVVDASKAAAAGAKKPRAYELVVNTADDGTQTLTHQLPQAYQDADRLMATSMKMGTGTATPEETKAAMDAVAKMAAGSGGGKAAKAAAIPSRNAREAIERAVDFGNRTRQTASNAVANSPFNPRNQVRQLIDSLPTGGKGALTKGRTNINAANAIDAIAPTRPSVVGAAKGAAEKLGPDSSLLGRMAAGAGAGGRQLASNALNAATRSTPGMLGGFMGSIPLSYFNYMGETGDSNLANAMANMVNPSNIAMLVAPGILRHTPGVRSLYGTLGLQGRGGNPNKPAGSIRARGIGNNVQAQPDDAYGTEEFQRRLRMAGGGR